MQTPESIGYRTRCDKIVVMMILAILLISGVNRAECEVTAERSMPACYLPGEQIVISIDIVGDADSVVVREITPSQCEIVRAFRGTIEDNVITWEQPVFSRCTYTLAVPEDATGDLVFSGTINDVPIGGDAMISAPVLGPGRQAPVTSGACYPYWIYLPSDYSESGGPWPLILSFHGANHVGGELQNLKDHDGRIPGMMDDPANAEMLPQLFRCIVVSPVCTVAKVLQGTSYWNTDRLEDFLEELFLTYRIDPRRVYLMGSSMGGQACWDFASKFPERVAAIVPISACLSPLTVVKNLGMTSTWAFHGDADTTVRIEWARATVDRAREFGGEVTFTVYPGEGHDVWRYVYPNPEVYEWLLGHSRLTVASEVPFWELY